MINKFIVISSLFVVFCWLPTTSYQLPTYAAEATGSAILPKSASPSASIREKLEKFKKEIASKAAKLKVQVENKLKDKAYVGFLKTRSETSITIVTPSGAKIINVNEDTVYESKINKKKKISLNTLTEEDYLSALGDVDESDVLTARKIILMTEPVKVKKTYLWGQVISLSDKLANIKNKDLKNIALSLNGAEVKLNDFIILTGNFNKNDIFEADFVHVIENGGILKTKKDASASAKVSSPSTSPKSSANPKQSSSPKPSASPKASSKPPKSPT